jgi:hypothetical protein
VLPEAHVEVVNGVPVTTAARCAIEVCTQGSVEQALVTVNGLLNAGHTDVAGVKDLAHNVRFWPDMLNTHVVLRLMHPRIESAAESRTWSFCWSEHLPRPVPQFEVLDELGRVIARLDFAWPEHGVFLEFDGREKYRRHRRPGETLEAFIMREKKREELVCLLTGWVCIRITWEDLNSPQLLARRVRAVLDSRARAN